LCIFNEGGFGVSISDGLLIPNSPMTGLNIEQSVLNDHIEHYLENSSTLTFWKDKHGKYLGSNTLFATTNKVSLDDVKSMNDFDFGWGDSEVGLIQRNDKVIMQTGKQKSFVETCIVGAERKQYLSHKSPLRAKNGKILGVLAISVPIDVSTLSNELPEVKEFSAQSLLLNKIKAEEFSYSLTKRQLDCLFLLTKGMTIKQIANELQLSPRTVGHYLEAIKIKLDCYSRYDLIQRGLQDKYIQSKIQIQGQVATNNK
jgi:DNA-binding NarL/FixJ family response regulator